MRIDNIEPNEPVKGLWLLLQVDKKSSKDFEQKKTQL